MIRLPTIRLAGALLCLALLAGLPSWGRAGPTVTVFAAASLKPVLEDIAGQYSATAGTELRLVFGGSSSLARQIRQGAPAQVFISANAAWMDVLEADGLLVPGSRVDLLSNRLALVAGPSGPDRLNLSTTSDLGAVLGNGRLAMALVDAVPAGLYGKAALQHLGLWESVRSRLVETDNVRAALVLVALGEAPMGIVYETDAADDPRVRVLDLFPQDSHDRIVYPAALLRETATGAAAGFLDYLGGDAARHLFVAHGFAPIADGS